MGLLTAALDAIAGPSIHAADPDPGDERWWTTGPVYTTHTGLTVTPRLAMGVSVVWLGVRLIAETLGSMPLKAYRELDGGGKERVRGHLGERLFHPVKGAPNPWQTGQQLRETLIAHSVLWGSGYARIRYGGSRIALIPLDPDTVEVDQLPDYRLRYKVHPQPDAAPGSDEAKFQVLQHEEVFRVQGLAIHRFMPPSLLALCREFVGTWLATQKFNSLYFAQGARPGAVLSFEGRVDQKVLKEFREKIREKWSGVQNMHRLLVGDQGLKATSVGWSAKDSQLSETWESIVAEGGRWLNMPVHLLGGGKQPTFASIVEFGQQFKDLTLGPPATRFEGAICRDLIIEDDIVMEHVFEGLLRGRTLERFQAYASAIMNGWMSEDEVREKENLNPLGLGPPRRSVNQDRGGEPTTSPERTDAQAQPPRRLRLIATGAARRAVTKELAAVRREAERLAADPQGWSAWLREWYGTHAQFVSEVLELEPGVARAYCESHRDALIAGGLAATEGWETAAATELLHLTLEEHDHEPD